MNKFTLKFVLLATLVAAPSIVKADAILEARCTTDLLGTNAEALARIEWARRCALLTNTGGPASFVPSTHKFDMTFNWAKEYVEGNTSLAFTGADNQYNVNYYYNFARYEDVPQVTCTQEPAGSATAGYYKWSSPTERVHIKYPTFDSQQNFLGTQLFPNPSSPNDCRLYTKSGTGALTLYTGPQFVVGYCDSGCYAPDQNVRFSVGDVNIVDAVNARRDDLVTLSADATLEAPRTQVSSVYSYTAEIRDAKNTIFKVTTASGGSLSVTSEHPVLTSKGRLVKAEKLRKHDALLKADGTPDQVVKIEKTTQFGKVYNVKPMATEPVSNILIAQGYLVGSGRFQNDEVKFINRIILMHAVPDDVIPK